MVSPASGLPFGWRKNTGSLSDTLTGWPLVVAGSNRSSREPATAEESSPGYPDDSTTLVDSGHTTPVLSM